MYNSKPNGLIYNEASESDLAPDFTKLHIKLLRLKHQTSVLEVRYIARFSSFARLKRVISVYPFLIPRYTDFETG